MAAFMKPTMKMKRKDLELDDFSDDFSEFSISAPARKIRRLDAELPPIMEEEEAEIPSPLEVGVEGGVTDDLELEFGSNEDRAIVLFKPVNEAPLLRSSPSNISFSVDSEILSGFKNQLLGLSKYGHEKSAEDEEYMRGRDTGCLAVVPWVPSQLPPASATEVSQTGAPEPMEEAEEVEAAMDIEETESASIEQGHTSVHDVYSELAGSDGLHQWQQQHCMIPQIPQNTSTPITWFR